MRVWLDGEALVKEAESDSDRLRLAGEAAILRVLAHPGVVRLERLEADPDRPDRPHRLVLGRVIGTSLAESSRQTAADVVTWAAGVASILADLHARGYAHGRISADHILLDERGRPVLCGFGAAGRIDEGVDPDADVAALAGLVRDHLGPADVVLRRTAGRWASSRRARRGGARTFARSLVHRAPAARSDRRDDFGGCTGHAGLGPPAEWADQGADPFSGPSPATPAAREGADPPGRRLLAGGLAIAASAAISAVVAGWAGWSIGRPGSPAPPGREQVPAYVLAAAPGEHPVMVVGRWGCGTARPAVLDEASGAIWLYPGWPAAGARLTGRLVRRDQGATGLAVASVRPGCDRLLVIRASLPALPLPVDGG